MMTFPAFGPDPLAGLPIYSRKVTISSAQILALFTSPVALVPAPSPNQMLLFQGYIVELIAGTSAYAALALSLKYSAGADLSVPTAANFLAGTSNMLIAKTGSTLGGATAPLASTVLGSGMILTAASNPTGGNGTIRMSIYYSVVTP
jgi:hypothetical protein